MKIKKIFYTFVVTLILLPIFASCGIFGKKDTCGLEGEAEVKLGKDVTQYCSITAQFRESSVTFDESKSILLVNLLGYDFEEEVTEDEKRNASAFGLRERTSMEKSGSIPKNGDGEDVIDKELLNKIIDRRQIMIEIPYEGTGTYKSEKIFAIIFKNDELIYRFTPSNKKDKLTFSLRKFTTSDLSEEEMRETVFRVASEEDKSRVKKVNISAKLTGKITIDGEQLNINSKINFTTVVEIPQTLLSEEDE